MDTPGHGKAFYEREIDDEDEEGPMDADLNDDDEENSFLTSR